MKGRTFLDLGNVYAPYVPMAVTPVVHNTSNVPNPKADVIRKRLRFAGLKLKTFGFSPLKGMVSRYARQQVKPSYFGSIAIGSGSEQTNEENSDGRSKDSEETRGLLPGKGNGL